MTIGGAFPEVLAAAVVGAEWAWVCLVQSVAASVRGYLASQGAHDPDGLTGEVFLHLVRGLGDFQGDEAGFRSWVFLVAHHRLVDERRRRRRGEMPARADRTSLTAPSAEAEVLDGFVDGFWRERLARLSEDQRSVILLRVVGDLPAEEVARILGKRPGTIRVLQHRALSRLRADLEAGVTR